MSAGPILYPNVTQLPGQSGVGAAERQEPKKTPGTKAEFDHVLEQTLGQGASGPAADLTQVKQPLKFSAHASQRLSERKIQLDAQTLMKVNDAIDRAGAKGVEDTLVLTDKAALIINVPNRTVVTALDKNNLSGNVFTNIDGAVIV